MAMTRALIHPGLELPFSQWRLVVLSRDTLAYIVMGRCPPTLCSCLQVARVAFALISSWKCLGTP